MLVTDPAHPTLETRPPERDLEGSAHLLRLCLDLQLDAMLLALGALAVDQEPDAVEPPGDHAPPAQGAIPWRRWITEDVDLACHLAVDARARHAALPPTLGSDLAHAMPVTTIDDLVARYTSMQGLLADFARRTEGSRPPGIEEAIERCEARLVELRQHKLVHTPPTGIDLRAEQHFLPGELLG